ncbi:hypothetical protein FNU76_04060 [Chitinimonas arctica]|uniref:DUF4189 domain-containing protein n=1 Tax=Chitinimonas arctica TaxID=2594795 RepID=A0A516SBR8_9NEIS|nr:hypothetical protein [Chitinimonas arctica]QDQ25592.1 hypothetical protein FNU76_04060 [Chitinimonas arctica]
MRRALFRLGLMLALPLAHATPPQPDPGQAALIELRNTIGDGTCQKDAQCHTVALGAKACGGPAFYLPWSDREGLGERVKELAATYTRLSKAQAEATGEMSDCSVISDPGAVCRLNRCVLEPAGRKAV